MDRRILVLTGPTAAGKSGLAMDVARRVCGEIVSADSRQVYRGLDIGTAKPSAAERDEIPHHFVDERALDEPFTAGQFAREAEVRIAEIRARGRVPVVVGGSMLYVDALVNGIADLPTLPPGVREALTERASTEAGRREMFEQLTEADPDAAATLDPTKSHRLIRLVGVLEQHGPPSAFWRAAPPPAFFYNVVVLDRPREILYGRIHARIDAMLADGLVEEVRGLVDAGWALDRGALNTIGYAEPAAYLRGDIPHDEMVRLLQRNTRRFAKRQWTWLRRRESALWLNAETVSVEALAEKTRTAVG